MTVDTEVSLVCIRHVEDVCVLYRRVQLTPTLYRTSSSIGIAACI